LLTPLADRVERQHDRILVNRNGRPSFVLMSPDDLEDEQVVLIHRVQDRRDVYRPR
jgi:PHD/YefM family antitoxin component YafN of YafNO toxin-antitoxin module